MTMDLDKEVSLFPISSSTNSLNFSSASNHLDQVPSLSTQRFEYGFPSNLYRLGSDHLQNLSHSCLNQPLKGFAFGSSSTSPQLGSHQIPQNYSSSLYETCGHYNFSCSDSSSLSSSSLPLGSDKGRIRKNGSDGIRIQDDDNHCEKGYRGVSRTSYGKKWQARVGELYLGIFDTPEDAAKAYDIVAIAAKGSKATTNFEIRKYDIKRIQQSEMIPVGKGASKYLQRTPATEVLKRITKNVKKPGALKLQEQSLVEPTKQNTKNIIPPPPQNPSYPQVILDLQGADHGKIDAQNVPTLQEDQSLISDRNHSFPSLFLNGNVVQSLDPGLLFEISENPGGDFMSPNPSSPTFYPHQNPDAQLEGIPREGSKSSLVDDIIDPTAVKATNGSFNGLLASDFEQKIAPYNLESLLCQSPNSQNFPTFSDRMAAGASSGTGSISGAILGSINMIELGELWKL